MTALPEKKVGFDIQTDEGQRSGVDREVPPRRVQASYKAEDASIWLRRYQDRGGAIQALQRPRRGQSEIPGAQRFLDGRTVAGLNRSKARLVASGLDPETAAEVALNRLAAYRASRWSDPAYQRRLAKRRAEREAD